MGMLIRRHRDRHESEHAEVTSDGPSKAELAAEAKALGLSVRGNKTELADRLAEFYAEQVAKAQAEADAAKASTEDKGAGNTPDPEATGTPDPDAPGGTGTTEGTPSSE